MGKRMKADARRETLIKAARRLFVEKGYDATKMEEIAEAAGCTTGPLYHFFKTKKELFDATLSASIDIANRIVGDARNATVDSTPLVRLGVTCDQLLDFLAIPETTMFVREAPRVIGRKEWHKLRRKLMLHSFESDLRNAMIAGEVAPEPPGPLAAILGAAIIEAVDQVNAGRTDEVEPYRLALRRLIARLKLAVPDLHQPAVSVAKGTRRISASQRSRA